MNKLKKLLCLVLCFGLVFAMAACGGDEESEQNEQQNEENNNEELTEEEAWKLEPAYGETLVYYLGDGCTSGPLVADLLGYYEEAGLKVEGYKGSSYTEALGANAAQIAVGHIATMLVPCSNNVDLTFVGGAHIGCKSLYVMADSPYQTTEDLKGLKIATPNGIGASDYNITARLLDADGINPLEDVSLVQVESSACVPSMQSGEIAAALLSDTAAYHMVEDGTLRVISSRKPAA